MRSIGVYLLYAAVGLRAVVVFAGDPQLGLVVGLLAAYGLLLFAGPRLIAGSRLPPGGERRWMVVVYLAVQAGLTSALLFIPSTEDFLANLFVILGMDAVVYFGWRGGLRAIVLFASITALALGSSAQGPLFGVVMAALYGGVALLLGGYAHQMQRVEAGQQENERLAAELERAHGQLRRFVSQAEEIAAEQERGRLAREMHDSVTQTVFSMNLAAQGACLLLTKEPSRVAGELERLEELAEGAMREIQELVTRLSPRSEAAESLPQALHHLAAHSCEGPRMAGEELKVSLEIEGQRALSTAETIGLYAITQEALSNVSRHAGTGRAIVRLKLAEGRAWLEIEDDGPGFEPERALAEPGHLGLAGIAERAREIGWKLTIDAGHGRGTRIRVEEPAR